MNPIIEQMLKKYNIGSTASYENALKEIIQEIALLGLWRAKFFEHAAFYGGTALRIFYGMDRFSEDLDFSLLKPNLNFDLTVYHKAVYDELTSLGFNVEIKAKEKQAKSAIQSAFIKADTQVNNLEVYLDFKKKLKIKFEVDTNPPGKFETEMKYLLNPTEFYVKIYSPPDLFAGKIHAVLFRKWGERLKGRDWYDFIWFVKNNIPVHLEHLQERMKQTDHLEAKAGLGLDSLQALLKERIEAFDIDLAKKDIEPFISDSTRLNIWSKDFFLDAASKIRVI